uniref:Uncharacterized protein n=1 Tax=Periophthalmus magnuspinnatus TaxID=409849 RepID=A0A3B4AE88_9GOBI
VIKQLFLFIVTISVKTAFLHNKERHCADYDYLLLNRNLSSVPPNLEVGLRRLDLSNNYIRRLDALALPYLEQLDVSSNQLHLISGDFSQNLARLEELNLSRNRLNNNVNGNGRALQSVNKLKILDVSLNRLGNEAVELYLQNKNTLDHLKMSGNVLRRLSRNMFEDCKNLKSISIDNNLISVIEHGTFESLRQLEKLNLAQNNLANICDFKLYNLKYLNLSRNSIVFFVTHENDIPYRLETLDLSFNKLLYFPIVPKLNHLRYLYLQQNNIGAMISEDKMVTEDNALYNEIVHGTRAEMNKNYLHYNWRIMPLMYIDLSYNHFQTFPVETLSLLSSLETLNFSHNCVDNISWNIRNESESGFNRPIFYSSLKRLDLQSNNLVYISPRFVETLSQIESLNLQDNSVQPCSNEADYPSSSRQTNEAPSCVSLTPLRTLKHLNLRENNITILYNSTFERINLISLNLGNNPRMTIQNGALESSQKTLKSLTLSELNISEIVLPCMSVLTQLNLSNNVLNVFPSNITCSPLVEMDISNNMFQYLDESVVYALDKHVKSLYVSGNPFKCCENTWLTGLNELKVTVPDMNNAQCLSGGVKIQMKEYLTNYTMYCGALNKSLQNHNFGQLLIVIVFVVVLFTAVYVFCRNMCSLYSIV